MSLYAFWCRDGEGSETKRAEQMGAHLAHIEENIDRFAVAGPLKDGGETRASLLVIKAESLEDARSLFESDPYFAAGVWDSVEGMDFAAVAGDWVGGAAWKQ